MRHAFHGRANNLAQHFGVNFRRHHGCRRIRAHAAGIWPLVAVQQAFVVLAGGQWQNVFAIHHHHKAGFFAVQKLLNHHARTSSAQLIVGQHHVNRVVRFLVAHGDNNAFACSQAIGLNHNRRALRGHIIMRFCGTAKCRVSRGGNVVAYHKRFGKVF